jgi:hypothetical protein
MDSFLGYIFEEMDSGFLSSHQLSRVAQLGVGLHEPLFHLCWAFGLLACLCGNLAHAIPAIASSCVQLLFAIWSKIPRPLALPAFLVLLSQ